MYKKQHFIVTGGSTGIGLACAERFAALGADVTIIARDLNKLALAKKRVEAAHADPAQQVRILSMDITDEILVKNQLGQLLKQAGAPRLLFNCAGAAFPKYFEATTLSQCESTMQLNFFATRNVIASLLPAMKEKGGHIINTSSLAGLIGVFGYTDYCASKFALIGFSEALRAELKPQGVKVSVLCPPDTDTPGFANENLTKPKETMAISKGANLMTPEQVADQLMRYLFSNKFLVIPGIEGKFSYYAKRFVPSIVEFVMDRIINRVQKN